MENWRTWNTSHAVGLHLKLALENCGEHKAHGEQLVALQLKLALENSGEYRARREQEDMEYQPVALRLKLALENSGEYRAHGEQENMEYQLASWIAFEVNAGEQWRTQSTWRTGERGILATASCQHCHFPKSIISV